MPESLLRYVTITGADDSTDPAELVALSREFPFVEWGILRSRGRMGTPRYPSTDWLNRCADAVESARHKLSLSLHLCGELAREAMAGDPLELANMPANVRCQLNARLETPKEWPHGLSALQKLGAALAPTEIILQVAAPQGVGVAECMAAESPNFSALYDPSGGRGVPLESPLPKWTTQDTPMRMGFAGGIGPDNVVSVIEGLIRDHRREFWIDMESGVRTDGKLDLAKVRRVLWLAAPFFVPSQEAGGA